jgi:methyl-accepting chemotaxis protein
VSQVSVATEQISSANHDLSQRTERQNAALVEQTATASEGPRDQANKLVSAASQFKLR